MASSLLSPPGYAVLPQVQRHWAANPSKLINTNSTRLLSPPRLQNFPVEVSLWEQQDHGRPRMGHMGFCKARSPSSATAQLFGGKRLHHPSCPDFISAPYMGHTKLGHSLTPGKGGVSWDSLEPQGDNVAVAFPWVHLGKDGHAAISPSSHSLVSFSPRPWHLAAL